ncbi:MAG: TolC family protein [Pirellulales bacterium]
MKIQPSTKLFTLVKTVPHIIRQSCLANGITTSLTLIVLMLVSLIAATGCHRSREFYRLQADEEVLNLVSEKATDPRWCLPDYHIDPDPKSRMYYPFAIDCPPMPLDDPTSNQFMHYVDDKHGYWGWEKNGIVDTVENPDWQAYLPVNEDGTLTLDSDSVVELARLHSPDYQTEMEDLYFSALDVSFQRFRFDTQFYGGYETIYTADGRLRAGDSSSELDASTRGIQMKKLSATGGELVVGLANSLVWQFSGSNSQSVNTLLDFSLVQPLLRNGGRVQVLERLTQAERDLLANVRQLERFNRAFYLEIVAGRSAGPGVSRSAGFPGIGASGAFNAGGFMGLLQREQNIRNQESNIAALRSSLSQLEAFFEAGRIDSFQVELTRQSLFRDQSSLLTAKTSFQDSLDLYKIDLGLPPELEITLNRDDFFDQFNLIDPAFTPVQNRLNDIQVAVGDLVIGMLPEPGAEIDPNQLEPELDWDKSTSENIAQIRDMLVQVQEIQSKVSENYFPLVREDMQNLDRLIPSREKELKAVQQRLREYESTAGEKLSEERVSTGVLSIPRLKRLPGQLNTIMNDLDTRFVAHEQEIKIILDDLDQFIAEAPNLSPTERYTRAQKAVFGQIPNKITSLISDLLGLSLVQARARTESITLVPVKIDSMAALDVARENRRDWMNARAALVDSWREIEFFAQDLQSDLDVVFSGDISSVGKNPVKLRGPTGRLQVGLEWDAPLTRLVERNDYRESLIDYQRTRRQFYQFRDGISRGLRDTIRTLDLNHINFELRRAAVQVAISQVERTQLRLQEPGKPNQIQKFNSSTARDLINALDSLLSAQNDFLGVAVNFEVLRRSLDLDMGTMQIDDRGIWLDPGPIDESYWIQPPSGLVPAEESTELFEELEKPEVEGTEVLLLPFAQNKNGEKTPLSQKTGEIKTIASVELESDQIQLISAEEPK